MRQEYLAIGLMVCQAVGVPQAPPAPQELPAVWAEKLFGAPANRVHDFGIVPRGAQLRHEFVLTNIYSVPVEITNIRGGGCGGPISTPSKLLLLPGESATIHVWVDGRRFVGRKQRSVDVYFSLDSKFIAIARLTVLACTRADVVCDPGEAAFGVVKRGQAPSVTIDVNYSGGSAGSAWRIDEVVVPQGVPFIAAVKQLHGVPGVNSHEIVVTIRPDAPRGEFLQKMMLKTNQPDEELMPLLVRGRVE